MTGSWLPSYLLVVLLWGGSYGVTEVALTAFSPSQVAMWRALIGAACLAVILVAAGGGLPRLGKTGWSRIALLAGLTAIASVSATAAQCRMPSAIVAVLCAMTPLFAAVLCHLRRIPTPAIRWIGVGLGVVGVAVLLSPGGNIDAIGVLLGLTAAACFALSGVLAATFFPGSVHSGSQLTMAQLLCSGLLLVPVTPVSGLSLTPSGPLAAVLILGVLAAAVENVLFWRVLRLGGPRRRRHDVPDGSAGCGDRGHRGPRRAVRPRRIRRDCRHSRGPDFADDRTSRHRPS
jgi:drug/metabolite transporter (DMT)-like permease